MNKLQIKPLPRIKAIWLGQRCAPEVVRHRDEVRNKKVKPVPAKEVYAHV